MTIDEWNGTVAIDVEDILRCLFEALAIRYISMAPFLTSRVFLLSLSDKSTGDVLGHVDMNYAIGSFCSSDLTKCKFISNNKVAQTAIMEAVKSRFGLRVHVSVQGAQQGSVPGTQAHNEWVAMDD